MKRFGIYVPEQDAAWEREGNTFAEIMRDMELAMLKFVYVRTAESMM